MRHLRLLLRSGGRLLMTAPFGKRTVSAWLRVYDAAGFRRLTRGFRVVSSSYYRRDGERFIPCDRDELRGVPFDFAAMRSGGVVLAELTPVGGLAFALARLELRLRRTLRRLTSRGPWWQDPWTGEAAASWLRGHRDGVEGKQ
jgi:hypothetical protein